MSTPDLSDSDFDPVSLEEEDEACNYCNRRGQLLPGKPYCGKCRSLMFRECRRCKKPYHLARYFEKDDLRCNSCFEKLQHERLKRAVKKHKPVHEEREEDNNDATLDPSKPKKKKKKTQPVADKTPSQPAPDAPTFPTFGSAFTLSDAKVAYIPVFFK